MKSGIFTIFFLAFTCLFLVASLPAPALAVSEDLRTLGMYYEAEDLEVTTTRNPKPLSQTAENVTIVTAAEIEMMGAHTLVDVLANVPGIQAADRGGPGSFAEFNIWGAPVYHILVMQDGVPLNFIGTPYIDIAGFPIQNIARIEIVKGPGSSSWGSSLGGVVNIVTKSPLEDKKAGGTLSFSGGERGTRDSRGEISGTVGPLGYYLYAGNLTSEGFRTNASVDQNDLFAKLRWEFPERGTLQFTIAYDRGVVGDGDTSVYDFFSRLRRRYFLSTLSYNYPVNDKIDLDLSLRTTYKKTVDFGNVISTGEALSDYLALETSNGGSAKVTWRERMNSLSLGVDFDHWDIDYGDPKLSTDKYGVFLNDTLTIGKFSITPSFRYDKMRPVDDFFSTSLGVAWNLTDKVTLRAYGARGYSLPVLKPNDFLEKVISVQSGVETTLIPYLWLKGTFFWNQLSDVHETDPNTYETIRAKELKQGVEVEGKTMPIFNTTLSAGYTFIDAKNRDTGATLKDIPSQLVKVGIQYDNPRLFQGSLFGRYGWLNASPDYNGSYTAMIWDLHLAKKFFTPHDTAMEFFFNVHNLFNGAQYGDAKSKNPRRWVEGGIKFNF